VKVRKVEKKEDGEKDEKRGCKLLSSSKGKLVRFLHIRSSKVTSIGRGPGKRTTTTNLPPSSPPPPSSLPSAIFALCFGWFCNDFEGETFVEEKKGANKRREHQTIAAKLNTTQSTSATT